jgi:short-subunit dehydrogenase
MSTLPVALVTGASSGIGATYADRLAQRGHDLVLVARDVARLGQVAERIRGTTGRRVDIVPADLTQHTDLERVAARLREDANIGLLVNNAGVAPHGGFLDHSTDDIARAASSTLPRSSAWRPSSHGACTVRARRSCSF